MVEAVFYGLFSQVLENLTTCLYFNARHFYFNSAMPRKLINFEQNNEIATCTWKYTPKKIWRKNFNIKTTLDFEHLRIKIDEEFVNYPRKNLIPYSENVIRVRFRIEKNVSPEIKRSRGKIGRVPINITRGANVDWIIGPVSRFRTSAIITALTVRTRYRSCFSRLATSINYRGP